MPEPEYRLEPAPSSTNDQVLLLAPTLDTARDNEQKKEPPKSTAVQDESLSRLTKISFGCGLQTCQRQHYMAMAVATANSIKEDSTEIVMMSCNEQV